MVIDSDLSHPPYLVKLIYWALCSGMAAVFGSHSFKKEWDYPYWLIHPTILFSDPWIELHASIAIFSYGIFALLAIVSSMYLIQRKAILSKKRVYGEHSTTYT